MSMENLLVISGIIANLLSIGFSLAALWKVRAYFRDKAKDALGDAKDFVKKI